MRGCGPGPIGMGGSGRGVRSCRRTDGRPNGATLALLRGSVGGGRLSHRSEARDGPSSLEPLRVSTVGGLHALPTSTSSSPRGHVRRLRSGVTPAFLSVNPVFRGVR